MLPFLFRNHITLCPSEFLSDSHSDLRAPPEVLQNLSVFGFRVQRVRKNQCENLSESSPAGLGREPPKFALYQGDSNGQALKPGLIPFGFAELQQLQSPVSVLIRFILCHLRVWQQTPPTQRYQNSSSPSRNGNLSLRLHGAHSGPELCWSDDLAG